MKKDIILIGPVGVGKSTVGTLLSEKLGIPQASLDELRWQIYEEAGYDAQHADTLFENEGFLGIYKYWKPFEALSVAKALALYPGHIHDFGAGQSVYEEPHLLKQVRDLLSPYPNVVLLLPCEDKKEALEILAKRTEFEHNSLFLDNTCNEELAKIVVYTNGKTPDETCDEIISKLSLINK